MKSKFLLIILAFITILTSCQRLDDNLYNQEKLKKYSYDKYTGDVDFKLDDTYRINGTPGNSNTKRVQGMTSGFYSFLLYSQAATERDPIYCSAVYLGRLSTIKTDKIILYCHGNKSHMDFYWNRAKLLAGMNGIDTNGYKGQGGVPNGVGVVIFDYRGYGLSHGKPSEEGMYADVEAALNWLKLLGVKSENLTMYGFSLGSAPVCELAAKSKYLRPSKIILEAPFASAEAMVQDAAGLNMPATAYTDLVIDNSEEIKNIKMPLMWIHGTKDDFLNINTHGQLVYNNHSGAYKEAHKIEGAGHSSVQTIWGLEESNKAIWKFINMK